MRQHIVKLKFIRFISICSGRIDERNGDNQCLFWSLSHPLALFDTLIAIDLLFSLLNANRLWSERAIVHFQSVSQAPNNVILHIQKNKSDELDFQC